LALYTGYTTDGCDANTLLPMDRISAATELDGGEEFTINNGTTSETIKCIEYTVTPDGKDALPKVTISSAKYADYFKVGSDAWRVFSNK
jgi:hypothetical protein